jgi:two-component system sensor histidine kinase HydH
LAHEIKNPLAAIKTFTECLPERHHDSEFVRKYGQIVSQELSKIQGILGNLLTFAKPQPMRSRRLWLGEVLEQISALLSADCEKRGVQLEAAAEPDAIVMGDPVQLKQAVLNLCLNSLDAMPDGGRLRVSALRNCRSIHLVVEDSGTGISAQHVAKLFEPFFTTKESGTGLGLSVVHGIVKQHRGEIEVHSRAGETRMLIQLPVVEPVEPSGNQ